jgi:hypothetical protein
MATFPSHLGALRVADEAAFAEVSTTFDERLPAVNSANEMAAALEQSKVPVDIVVQYQNDGRLEADGIYGGSFPITMFLTGHGSTCAGAISITGLGRALGRWLGINDVTEEGTTVAAAPTSATEFALNGGTVKSGGLIRVGAIDDARGQGQAAVVNNASTITLLTALDATPNENDVVYAMETVHPAEDDTAATIVSERYQIQTANQKYDCRGCYCTSLAFTGFNTGEIPQVTAQINPSYWFPENTSTWPTPTNVDSFTPAPVSAGSFFIQTVGTTTRNLLNVRDVQFNVDLQAVIGVRRVRCQSSITFTVDSDAPGTDVLGDIWTGTDLKHILYTLSAEDGSAMAIYMPNAKAVQVRPTQHDRNGVNCKDRNGVNCKTITMLGLTGPTSTSDLLHSNFRIGLG